MTLADWFPGSRSPASDSALSMYLLAERASAGELTGDDALLIFDTNVVSIVRVTNAFLPLLERSDAPVVVNVSSGMGSFALTQDPERVAGAGVRPGLAARGW